MQGNFTEFYVAHKLELRKGSAAFRVQTGLGPRSYAVWQHCKRPEQFIYNSTA